MTARTAATTNACPKPMARCSRISRVIRLLPLLFLLMLPAAVQALDFTYTTRYGQRTITGYTGSGGAVVIPDEIYRPVQ